MGEDFTGQPQGPSDKIEKVCADIKEFDAFIESITDLPTMVTIKSNNREEISHFYLREPRDLSTPKFHMRTNVKDKTGPWTVSVSKKLDI